MIRLPLVLRSHARRATARPLSAALLLPAAALALAACGSDTASGGADCETDFECLNGQTCQNNVCVSITDLVDVPVADSGLGLDVLPGLDSTPSDSGAAADGSGTGPDAADDSTADDTGSGSDTLEGRCGNGVVEGAEQCDDGNRDDLDDCTNACLLSCGDGVVAGFEACDVAIAQGQPGACPLECPPTNACATARLDGEFCGTVCVEESVTICAGGDGCCGAGCSAADDADCAAVCGNAILEPGETCDPAGSCPGASDCADDSACTTETLLGQADLCTASCSVAVISACASGDGCCPVGCSNATDSDCSASCGDGIVGPDETCDGNCPTTCLPSNSCAVATLIGSPLTCSVECVEADITAPVNGDGCCPAGANAAVDNDCAPICGNNVVETGESCDGSCPATCADGNVCTADTQLGSPGTCDVSCVNTAITACADGDGCCAPGCLPSSDSDCFATCGNGVTEPGETCDGADCPASCDDGLACTSDQLAGSADTCSAVCTSVPITSPTAGDGCCPSGFDSTTDADCTSLCGNDVLELGETCELSTCPTACDDGLACTNDTLIGDAATCNAACSFSDVTVCSDGDGCCATGCTRANDSDCVGVCGNGLLEVGEACDPLSSCPTDADCADGDACTADAATGTGCNVQCSNTVITAPNDADGCCPSGANANSDLDCLPVCGNGVVEPGETCEGDGCPAFCDDGVACTADSVTGAAESCTAACAFVAITTPGSGDGCCPSGADSTSDNDCTSLCGNGIVEAGETCEGATCPTSCNDGIDCTTDALTGSAGTCNAACTFTAVTTCTGGDGCCASGCNSTDDSDCVGVCGNGVLEVGEACDPIDSCPTLADCADADSCTADTLVGTDCNTQCSRTPITAPSDGDGCCPAGANSNSDVDCLPVCGNGVLEEGELCDGASCPLTCDDGIDCTADQLVGTDCGRQCVAIPIVDPANGDLCCPSGANANNDNDCPAVCGNGVVESGEICDGASCPVTCDDSDVCTQDTLQGSGCGLFRENTAITLPNSGDLCCPAGANNNTDSDCSPLCGNGVIEVGEICDGASCPASCPSDGQACTADTLVGGSDTCDATCSYDAITACAGGDGCCPTGCTGVNDGDCALALDPASSVTVTSSCLTVGLPGPAQGAVVIDLRDTGGNPVAGATVSVATTLGTVSAVSETGGRYVATLRAPNNTTGDAQITVTANGVALSTRPTVTIGARFSDVTGGAGGCAADGNVRVRVVDAAGSPISGAVVMVGTAPAAAAFVTTFGSAAAGSNNTTTNAEGYAVFSDFGATLDGGVTITAGATGREYVTMVGMNASDFVVPLRTVRPTTQTGKFTGQLTNINATNNVEAGLMLSDTTIGELASFSFTGLLATDECPNLGSAVGSVALPANVYIPNQTQLFGLVTIPEHRYTSAAIPYGNRLLYGLAGNLPLSAATGTGGLAAAVGQLTITNFGSVSRSVDAAGPTTQNINVASTGTGSTPLRSNVTCALTNYPAASDVFCVSAGDLDSLASSTLTVGEGRLFLMGFRTAVTTTTTTTAVNLSALTTLDNTGNFANIEYLSATAALYVDETRAGIPAGTANGISAVFNRTATDIGTGNPTVRFTDYLPVRTLARTGRTFALGAATNATSARPDFTEINLTENVTTTYTACAANDSTDTAKYSLWRVIAPASATSVSLPTLPAGWPRADVAGDLSGLIDPAATAATDSVEVRSITTDLGIHPGFSYNAFRFVDVARYQTHVSSNTVGF